MQNRFLSLKIFFAAMLILLPVACEKASTENTTAEKGSIVQTESGLTYEIIEVGAGASPNPSDYVTVHYEGKLEDGTLFDSSYDRNEPATFPANKVIQGWIEALALMKEGDKWALTIPPALAYGERGAGDIIPPNATLHFTVELIKVEPIDAIVADFEADQAAFLTENAKQKDVTVTDSGLQYQINVAGDGPKPAGPSTVVTVHYEGRLINGQVFDSSRRRGQPSTFALDRVIAGWTEGLQLMTVGSRYVFTIPADLAYGEKGTPSGSIAPNATLIFDVELIALED